MGDVENRTDDKIDAEERLLNNGYEDVVILKDYSYDNALIGVTHDNRAVYDFEQMVSWLMEEEGFTEEEALEWIEYNTIGALPFSEEDKPIVMYRLLE